MRRAFVAALAALARREPRVVFLTADLGYSVVEPIAEAAPGRFFNVGVAEQNLLGLATGLAEGGFLPFVYSIGTFASLRPYEVLRNGPVAHRLPVRVIGVGGGFDYGHAGLTHHALEDLAVLRAQPGLALVVPADARQAVTALERTWDADGPVYYRLGKDDVPDLPGLEGRYEPGRLAVVRDGTDALLVAAGTAAHDVLAAAGELASRGVSSAVAVVSGFNPSPTAELASLLSRFAVAVSVEHHAASGGLGSFVCEVAAESGAGCRVVRCAVERPPDHVSGSARFLVARHGLDRESLVRRVEEAVRAVGR